MYALVFTGIPTALTKFLGEYKSDNNLKAEYLSNSLFLMLAIFLLLVVAILIFASEKLLLILFLFALLIDLAYMGYARGSLDYLKLNGFKFLENVIKLTILMIAYLLFKRVSLDFSVVFYSLSSVVSLIIFEFIRPAFKIQWYVSRTRMIEIIRYVIPVTMGAVGWTLLFGISSVYVEHFYGHEQVGYFSIGLTLMQVFSFLPDAVNMIIMPKVAALKDKETILRPIKLAVAGCVVVSLVILIPLTIFRTMIVVIIFSDKYLPAVAVILPLGISQVFFAALQVYGSVWQGLGKPGIPSIIIGVATGLNIVLGYFLIKNYGIFGASVSLAICAFIAWLITVIYWRKWLRRGGLDSFNIIKAD